MPAPGFSSHGPFSVQMIHAPNSCRICMIHHLPRPSTSPSNFLPTCRRFQVSPTFNRMKPLLLPTSTLLVIHSALSWPKSRHSSLAYPQFLSQLCLCKLPPSQLPPEANMADTLHLPWLHLPWSAPLSLPWSVAKTHLSSHSTA